jgi:Na+-transporting NADH:ubiquinone oxidoreductase subunit B
MRRLRRLLDRIHPQFARGGPYHRYHALYEMVDTLLFTPGEVTRGAPHVRDSLDLKRVMITVVLSAMPCVLVGLWNTGYQANLAMAAVGAEGIPGWRGALMPLLGAGYDPASLYDNLVQGLLYFLPIYVVTMAVGGFWEILFSGIRNHEINEGFFVTSLLYVLVLPASIPLWQVALGISFGVVIGKEVFGGTGKNFLNPALTGRAFLYFAYPVEISGDAVWTTVDGYTGATALGVAALDGLSGVLGSGLTWTQAFLGQLQGSLGETSAAACLLGAVVLVYTGVASWRTMAGTVLGLVVPAVAFGLIESANPMVSMPWHWHLVLGGFAFGAVFMATDPVSSAQTEAGRWIYGLLIGLITYVIRVINPAFPEGIMLAILFGNIFAPVIDHFVIRANVKRRERRSA